jgi:hypothetical protein
MVTECSAAAKPEFTVAVVLELVIESVAATFVPEIIPLEEVNFAFAGNADALSRVKDKADASRVWMIFFVFHRNPFCCLWQLFLKFPPLGAQFFRYAFFVFRCKLTNRFS